MDNRDLVRMANQITAFFQAYPKSEAMDGIGKHLHLFWDPRMRNQLKEYMDTGGADLNPLFLDAAADYFKGPKTPSAKVVAAGDKPAQTGAAPASTRGT